MLMKKTGKKRDKKGEKKGDILARKKRKYNRADFYNLAILEKRKRGEGKEKKEEEGKEIMKPDKWSWRYRPRAAAF